MTSPLRDYFNRSGKTELGLGWMEENDCGFCVWRVEQGKLILSDVYGDGQYWNSWATKKAEELECESIFFQTSRNPSGFVKKYGYEVVGTMLERKL